MGQGFCKALWSVAPEWTLLLSVRVKSRQTKEVLETVFTLCISSQMNCEIPLSGNQA